MKPGRILRVVAKGVFALVDPLFGRSPGPRILIYHQIGTDLGREMEVPTETFHRQLDWMQRHGEIVDLETAVERRGEPGAARLFVLTFDDGFEDVYRNAFPIMKERGAPFTLYLTTKPIETGNPLDPRFPQARPLTWDQVNEMVGTGLATVGAHTHSHPDLRSTDPASIAVELDTSNRLIEERTGIVPRHFTYPWGWWSEQADPLVRARYDTATVGSGRPVTAATSAWKLSRLPIQRSDIGYLFRTKAATHSPVEAILRERITRTRSEPSGSTVVFLSVAHGIGGPTRSLASLLRGVEGAVRRCLVAPTGTFVDLCREGGVFEEYHRLPKWGRFSRISRVFASVNLLFWLIPRRRRVLCIHANGQAELNLAGLSGSLLRIPIVLWAHASTPSPSSAALAPVWRRLLSQRLVVAVSEEARAVVVATGLESDASSILIIPNPIGNEVVGGSRRTETGIVTVGYLRGRSPTSGFDLLPSVIGLLEDEPIRWLLFMGGPTGRAHGDDPWVDLERHIGSTIEVCGWIPEVDRAYARCDIVFVPSIRESFGRVAAEAMLNGIPVVATDIGAFRRLVGDGQAGLLFRVGDAASAAGLIKRLAGDPALRERLGAEGMRRAKMLSPDWIGEAFTDVYRTAGDHGRIGRVRTRRTTEEGL